MHTCTCTHTCTHTCMHTHTHTVPPYSVICPPPEGFKTLFNLTIASCECFTCWFSRKSRRSDISQLEDSGSGEDFETRCMKEELTFHFMNPFQKWRYSKKRRFPWKLLVQLISIVLVTTQVSCGVGKEYQFSTVNSNSTPYKP